MKKLFVLSCVALATLASCSKSEDVSAPQAQKEIAFNVATDKSRAPIAGADFPEVPMYVSAYNSVGGKYFQGVKFTKSGTTTSSQGGQTTTQGVWKGNQYWPVNGITSFLAYAYTPTANPQSNNAAGNDQAQTVIGDPTWGKFYADEVSFNIANGFFNSDEADNQTSTPYVDLVYASGEQVAEKNYNSISMQFKHTGAWVVFNVKLAAASTTTTVKLNKLCLANLFKGGKVVIDNNTYAGAKASWDFTGQSAAEYPIESFSQTATALSTDAISFGAIIPEQNQTAIKFNYTLSGDNMTAQDVDYEFPLNRFDKWEMGKKYVYNITINLNEIAIEPTVGGWAGTTIPDIEI